MLCLCHHGPALLRFWSQTDLGAKIHPVQAGQTFSYHGHALVTLYVQFLYSDWSKFDGWVYVENLCSILKNVYFDSWSWQSFVSTRDVFLMSFSTGCTKWNTAAIKSLLLFMAVCLLGFWLRNTSLVKVGIRFRIASFSFFTLLDA